MTSIPPLRLFASLLLLVAFSGCSIAMATRQPTAKNLAVLDAGTPRDRVIAELGWPQRTEVMSDNHRIDHFTFTQGYSKSTKNGRAMLHGAADTVTLGLWEIIGTPAEMVFDGTELEADVTYEVGRDVVKSSVVRKK